MQCVKFAEEYQEITDTFERKMNKFTQKNDNKSL